ncbi:hypothetical protein BDZ89DRAFT_1165195 [Hymenopellis radicata]|nr:hypothetical protein BDZ89DRAFT_1165195 [Hymenopellis radicata]
MWRIGDELKEDLSYIHEKGNLFTMCLILALSPVVSSHPKHRYLDILRDVMQLEPNHPEWKDCRSQLRLFSDGLKLKYWHGPHLQGQPVAVDQESFTLYRNWLGSPPPAKTLQKAKAALQAAISALDNFFTGEGFRPGANSHPTRADALAAVKDLRVRVHPGADSLARSLLSGTPVLPSAHSPYADTPRSAEDATGGKELVPLHPMINAR